MERHLAAILVADMVGYSRLMASDEVGTLTRHKGHRKELIDPQIIKHRGRLVNTSGDGLLAEFPSVIDAVQCAVTIQLAMPEREAAVPLDSRVAYRIGINLGDIIAEDGDIFGDGVNVAARLETLAEPGGICVSRTVMNHVRSRVSSSFDDMGERRVKNIPEPVHYYRVLMVPEERGATADSVGQKGLWRRPPITVFRVGFGLTLAAAFILVWEKWVPDIEPASVEMMAFPLPEKPSLAVLPFANLSSDPEQEYLADGITTDLITKLSNFNNLFVIASNSTYAYKSKPVTVQKVAEDLGVRYVLMGSIQVADGTARINTQLIDALSGHHLWAGRYDRDLNDIFALQNIVVEQVAEALSVRLEADEIQSKAPMRGLSQENYKLFKHARAILPSYFSDKNDLLEARRLFQQLSEYDPEFSGGHAGLSLTYAIAAARGFTRTPMEEGTKALKLAQRANELNADTEFSVLAMASAFQVNGQLEDAINILERLTQTSPSNADALARLGLFLIWTGRANDSIEPISAAIRLNPFIGSPYLAQLGLARFTLGQYEASAAAFEKNAAQGGSVDDAGLAVWIASYRESGRPIEAQKTLTRLINQYPGFHLRAFWLLRNYAQAEDRQRLMEILKRAGIPMDRPYTR